ncbi:MAG: 4-hydroxy-tetrahydrodipicolinate reductase [Planctomycetes bacterium]|nr:4-hydroxy-tetrahydrodipicolinate reductase [Planctomycetota bacterium]
MKTKVGVNGACGRMGSRIVQLVHEDPELAVTAALESLDYPKLGADIGELCGMGRLGVPVTTELTGSVDVVIDFSMPKGALDATRQCLQRQVPLVVATTGLSLAERAEIEEAGQEIALLIAPNMSLAVNLLMKLVGEAATVLRDADTDIEILERHHRFKKDAPSGTALEFARIISRAAGEKRVVHGRHGLVGERPRDEIGIHAVRVGDNVGEHTILFSLLGETLEFTHRAHSRDCYARGAIRAAKFLVTRKPGLYSMADVLGFS